MGTAGAILRETSPYGWLILVLLALGVGASLTHFVLSRKRARAPTWIPWVAPALLAVVGGAGYTALATKLVRAWGGGISDTRLTRIHALAEGTSEHLGIPVLAASAAAIVLAVSSLLLSLGGLRHPGRPRFDALAVIAASGGALFSVAALYMRHKTLAMLGMIVWSDRIFSPVVLPSVSFAVCALFVAATLAGEGGAVARADELARDRVVGAQAISAIAAALGAVVLTLVATQSRHWAVIFGAMSGESIDAAVREEIFQVGTKEARALLGGALVSLLPVLVTLGIATLPRGRILLRGTRGALPALGLFALTIAVFLATPTFAVPAARSAMLRAEAFVWPPGVTPVAVSLEHDQSGDFDGRVLSVVEDRCDPERIELPNSTDDAHPGAPPPPVAIAVDRNVTARTLHCYAAEVRRQRNDDESRPAVTWLVRSTEHIFTGDRKSGTFDVAVPTAVVATLRPLDDGTVHVHVTKTGWKYRAGGDVGEGTDEAPPIGRVDRRTVLVTADEDVPAQRLFDMIASSHLTRIVLGPAANDAIDQTEPEDATPTSAASENSVIARKQSAGFVPAEQAAIEASLRRAVATCGPWKRNGASVDVRLSVSTSGALKVEVTSKDRRRATCIQRSLAKNVHVDIRRQAAISFRVEPPRT